MQTLQQDSVSSANTSLRNATIGRVDDRIERAAALVSVSNRLRHEDVPRLLESAGKIIGQLASKETVVRVAETNPDAIWVFSRKGRERAEGFVSMLLLNEAGRIALLDGSLDLLDGRLGEPMCRYGQRLCEFPLPENLQLVEAALGEPLFTE